METFAKSIEDYHERTKHHPRRYARSAGYLDWESEPEPFRRYEGAPLVRLPLVPQDPDGSYAALFDRKETRARPFSLENISCFLELSLGLSAWKSSGNNSWPLRMNPSSGNLHPVEGYLVLPPLPELPLPGGVWHYNPLLHGLEARAGFGLSFWSSVRRFVPEGFIAILASVHWREAWKYGERAFRYSHLDMGHALAAMSVSAALLGWKVAYVNGLSDKDVEAVLGFDRTRWKEFEREEAGPLLVVHPAAEDPVLQGLENIAPLFESLSFVGEPNLLSRRHRDWSVIGEASAFTAKPRTREEAYGCEDSPCAEAGEAAAEGAQIIRRRRSASSFDGSTALAGDHFFRVLARTGPRKHCAPFDAEIGRPAVHLLLFVHRVGGMEPGLYFLMRRDADREHMREKCRRDFLWKRAPEAPAPLSLYLLEPGDFRAEAKAASCNQDIASDGAFAAAMIAQFGPVVSKEPYRYRHLHWEAGMIGQVLYLALEACGMRGTGMGCFFDDRIHNLLGLRDTSYQDLYHFGAGTPVEDDRITTLPPYHHLKKS